MVSIFSPSKSVLEDLRAGPRTPFSERWAFPTDGKRRTKHFVKELSEAAESASHWIWTTKDRK